jgi:predicted Zn-dependent peptidase
VYRISRLENGFTVATAEMPHMQSVSVGLWVGTGSRYEAESVNGVCHFIEHMVFKGTRRRSAREISEAVEGIGGYLNAFTAEETTCFHAKACHDRLDQLLDVLSDMLLNSRFAPADVAKERGVIKEELAMYLDEPQHQVQELLNATMWPHQPLGRPITGTNRSLDGLRRRELVQHLRTHYLAANSVLVVAGRVQHRAALRAFAPYASRFACGPAPLFSPASAPGAGPRVGLVTRKAEQTQLALGIRTCSRHDDRRYALRLLNAILGENMSSRLFQRLREDLGLAYSIYSTPSFFHDAGDLVIYAGLETGNVAKALRLILRELVRLKNAGLAPGELRRARDYVLGQIDLSLEGTENQMNWVGEQLLGYGNVISAEQIKKRLARVSAAQIRGACQDFFQRDRLNLALVSPLKSAATAERLLRAAF